MVRRIIVVGNEKGGTGKTTLSVNLAAVAVSVGIDTILVDADAQQNSASRWAARRRDGHPTLAQVPSVIMNGRSIASDLESIASRYALVIVDTGAEDSPELRAASTVASTLIIPAQPDMLDLWTLPTMEALYLRASAFNSDLRVVLAINRVPFQSSERSADEVREWVAENVPSLPFSAVIPLIGRSAYGRSSGDGLGVHEGLRRDAKAAAEFLNFYNQVMK